MRKTKSKPTRYICLMVLSVLTVSASVGQVHSLPTGANSENSWPNFGKRNVAALARDGYLKPQSNGYKRSVSTLAKNGQLPTFSSPYDDADKHEEEDDGREKRNLASIARMRSYSVMKRNIQALARDGYRGGRQSSQQNSKRNVASLARSGYIHKRGDSNVEEYYYPFYQNSVPPLSEMDGPLDDNEVYDFQQSVNPDFFPPLAQVFKRSQPVYYEQNDESDSVNDNMNYLNGISFKRGPIGLPVQGLFRPTYIDPSYRTKRYILSLPEPIEQNNLPLPDAEDTTVEDKRSVGSIPLTRISELGNISLIPKLSQQQIQTTPTYRRRQYLLTRTRPAASSTDRRGNELPSQTHHKDNSRDPFTGYIEALTKNTWRSNTKEIPRFYHFRSVQVPYHTSGKRYLLLPAIDNIMLRKTYPNGSLPSRRKNQ